MTSATHNPHHAAFLALDWGKQHAYAYLLDSFGAVIAQRIQHLGSSPVQGAAIADVIHAAYGDWLTAYPQMPIIACGMLGAREGLRETPHFSTPFNAIGLAHRVVRVDDLLGRAAAIVPGVCNNHFGAVSDVSRGMETRMLGLLTSIGTENVTYIVPGFHSLWVKVHEGIIDSFRSYMTEELFAILCRHTVLGMLANVDLPPTLQGFARGFECALQPHASLANLMFSTRTLGLFEEVDPLDLTGYLAGVLLGDEVQDGVRWAKSERIIVLESGPFTPFYQQALTTIGQDFSLLQGDFVVKGLYALAQQIDWSTPQ